MLSTQQMGFLAIFHIFEMLSCILIMLYASGAQITKFIHDKATPQALSWHNRQDV